MRRQWTKEEEEYLLSRYLNQSTERTAKQLNRTVCSVKQKAQKLGLNHYLDNIGAKAIAKCFGCDVSVILRWIHKFDLPAKRIELKTQTRYDIDPVKFWKWANKHRFLINWSNYKDGSLAPQPNWVKEEIQNHTQHKSRRRFTIDELSRIAFLLKKNTPYEDIAKEYGRSIESIKHVAKKIKKGNEKIREKHNA